ncbi:hypothetical protein BH09BAC1_BH09BAC1_15760 [soil metagenome]
MKNKITLGTYIVSTAIVLLIFFGWLLGIFSFVRGLGDLGMAITLVGIYVFVTALMIVKRKVSRYEHGINVCIIIIELTIVIYYLLALSILRGPELPWNGEIFV